MKKQLATILLLVFGIMVALTGCGGNDSQQSQAPAQGGDAQAQQQEPVAHNAMTIPTITEADGSWDRVVEAGKITAGLDDAYPPMGFHDPETNELTGFDIEMAGLISEKIGVPIEFVPADWNAIVPSLTSRNFDLIISGMNMWASRMEAADFVPYGVAAQVMVVRADYPDADQITDLSFFKDKMVGTQLGSTGAKVAVSTGFEEGKNLTLYKAFPDITLDLDNGRVDVLIIDSFGAGELVSKGDYIQVGSALYDETEGVDSAKIGIAINKEDNELQAKLQQAVNELIVDGSLGELAVKWTGLDFTEELKADAQAALDAAAAAE